MIFCIGRHSTHRTMVCRQHYVHWRLHRAIYNIHTVSSPYAFGVVCSRFWYDWLLFILPSWFMIVSNRNVYVTGTSVSGVSSIYLVSTLTCRCSQTKGDTGGWCFRYVTFSFAFSFGSSLTWLSSSQYYRYLFLSSWISIIMLTSPHGRSLCCKSVSRVLSRLQLFLLIFSTQI